MGKSSLRSALSGGLIAIVVMLFRGTLWKSLKNVGRTVMTFLLPTLKTEPLDPADSIQVPFGFGIAVGTAWAWALDYFGMLYTMLG